MSEIHTGSVKELIYFTFWFTCKVKQDKGNRTLNKLVYFNNVASNFVSKFLFVNVFHKFYICKTFWNDLVLDLLNIFKNANLKLNFKDDQNKSEIQREWTFPGFSKWIIEWIKNGEYQREWQIEGDDFKVNGETKASLLKF